MLDNPKLLSKLKADGKPSVEVPEEFKSQYVSPPTSNEVDDEQIGHARSGTANRILTEKEKERADDKGEGPSKKRRRYVCFCLVPYPQASNG